VHLAASSTWVSNMHTHPEHRRQGLAKALMTRMLLDDRLAGATRSVLLASHAGALLYPALGYDRIGTLHLFRNPKRATAP
jgi:predicted GNAT family acetyltransferase